MELRQIIFNNVVILFLSNPSSKMDDVFNSEREQCLYLYLSRLLW